MFALSIRPGGRKSAQAEDHGIPAPPLPALNIGAIKSLHDDVAAFTVSYWPIASRAVDLENEYYATEDIDRVKSIISELTQLKQLAESFAPVIEQLLTRAQDISTAIGDIYDLVEKPLCDWIEDWDGMQVSGPSQLAGEIDSTLEEATQFLAEHG